MSKASVSPQFLMGNSFTLLPMVLGVFQGRSNVKKPQGEGGRLPHVLYPQSHPRNSSILPNKVAETAFE